MFLLNHLMTLLMSFSVSCKWFLYPEGVTKLFYPKTMKDFVIAPTCSYHTQLEKPRHQSKTPQYAFEAFLRESQVPTGVSKNGPV